MTIFMTKADSQQENQSIQRPTADSVSASGFPLGMLITGPSEWSAPKSLLAPMVAHGMGNFTEVGIIIVLAAAWA